jgi:hypothetical protein
VIPSGTIGFRGFHVLGHYFHGHIKNWAAVTPSVKLISDAKNGGVPGLELNEKLITVIKQKQNL